MQPMHSGNAALAALFDLWSQATAPIYNGEAAIEFLLLSHTSLLDFGRAFARPFFCFFAGLPAKAARKGLSGDKGGEVTTAAQAFAAGFADFGQRRASPLSLSGAKR